MIIIEILEGIVCGLSTAYWSASDEHAWRVDLEIWQGSSLWVLASTPAWSPGKRAMTRLVVRPTGGVHRADGGHIMTLKPYVLAVVLLPEVRR